MFHGIVDIFPISNSISYFEQDDDEIMISFLGGMTDSIKALSANLWTELICHTAAYMYKIHGEFEYPRYCLIFDLT